MGSTFGLLNANVNVDTNPIGAGIRDGGRALGEQIRRGTVDASINAKQALLEASEKMCDTGLRCTEILSNQARLAFLEGVSHLSRESATTMKETINQLQIAQQKLTNDVDIISKQRLQEIIEGMTLISNQWRDDFKNELTILRSSVTQLVEYAVVGYVLTVYIIVTTVFSGILFSSFLSNLITFNDIKMYASLYLGLTISIITIYKLIFWSYIRRQHALFKSIRVDLHFTQQTIHFNQQYTHQLNLLQQTVVASSVPIGTIVAAATETVPSGWLICDGSALDVIANPEYTALVKMIGYKFSGINGLCTLPDLRGRVIIGIDERTQDLLGKNGGARTVTLEIENTPSHTHLIGEAGSHTHNIRMEFGATPNSRLGPGGQYSQINNNTYPFIGGGGSISIDGNHSHTNGKTGGDQPHENMQPYLVLNYIIKY